MMDTNRTYPMMRMILKTILAATLMATLGLPTAALAAKEVPEEFRKVFLEKGCHGCHKVESIPEATGVLGPPLDGISQKNRIAGGFLANTPENLATWLRNPKEVKVTLMTNTGLNEEQIAILVKTLNEL